MSGQRELIMTISLNALEHLGINLYSSIPAVLSEIVANAWDADAQKVKITIDKTTEKITIEDNGIGMDRNDVIDRFLTVGFKRRDEMGSRTALDRQPMGRKGIGKLSIFSIAQVAEVFTTLRGERTAFRMDREIIRKAIAGKGRNTYKPEELNEWPAELTSGTRIVLSKISKSLSGMAIAGLKRRVARRFSVIGSKTNFIVEINGEEVGADDRAYHKALQYLWEYGDQTDFINSCKNLDRPAESRLEIIGNELKEAGISLSGWIGTVSNPSQLKDEEGDNLNRIAIFMRGKMAQEDILDIFGQKEIYADYIIGEIHCEELDVDDKGDIATSSRQSLREDDPRFEALRRIVRTELRHIASRWSEWRRADGAKSAAKEVPAVSDWLSQLQGDTKKKAERWIGRLNTIRSSEDADKKELLKASILAFESYRRKEQLDKLDEIKDESVSHVLGIFKDIDDLEVSFYGQIVKLRLGVIKALQNKVSENNKELVIRDFIKEHLWLLDPSWERAKGSEYSETRVNTFLKGNTEKLKKKEKNARVDLAYRTAVGKHVIIELKRPTVSVHLDDLTKQIRSYRDGVKKIIDGTKDEIWPIEIICLLGKYPPEWYDAGGTGSKGVIDQLKTVDARIVLYDELLKNAQAAYQDYIEEHKKIDKLWKVFDAIENFTPSIDS